MVPCIYVDGTVNESLDEGHTFTIVQQVHPVKSIPDPKLQILCSALNWFSRERGHPACVSGGFMPEYGF